MYPTIMLVLSVVCFVLATADANPRYHFQYLGVAFYVASLIQL